MNNNTTDHKLESDVQMMIEKSGRADDLKILSYMLINTISVPAFSMNKDKPVLLAFPGSPADCDVIEVTIGDDEFALFADSLSEDATEQLKLLAHFIIEGDSKHGEGVITLASGLEMRVDRNGEYLRFVYADNEILYWSDDEFKEDAIMVLGAVAGAITSQPLKPI